MKSVYAGAFAPAHFFVRPALAHDADEPSDLAIYGLAAPASDHRIRGVSRAAYLQPGFSKGQDGAGPIAGAAVFASPTAPF